ncbi:diaminopimelate decarboxylase [Candidatus Vampirococcus lugosii]|uniref:Diaminopimelate decarboxylase n=1 Tax=Candidatus Vampirococcus lugosii TaxID=2789015 RepID=A0ABS5QKQ6_9BACT|nr:diaminopimelate decarboxylase [Candidatus Vampirococcus lugosii]MBS8121805.1 Diaminopimelate decarboxylase [Candidatus Vampirococcus lugosii]
MNFLNISQIEYITNNYKTPVYVYSENKILESSQKFLNFPNAFGLTVRYAMKANSNMNVLKILKDQNIKIDASSEYEVYRALSAGFLGNDIQISGQELSENFDKLINTGVFFVATSLYQLQEFGKLKRGGTCGIRINPGVGSGAFTAISTGGLSSSFGIWHEYIGEVKKIVQEYDLKITKIHLHIGSENTSESWVNTANIGLNFVKDFPDVEILNMGGGFKMAIMDYEKTADLISIGNAVKEKFEEFHKQTQRKIHLELEPGKYIIINAGSIIAKIVDIVDTGKKGYKFLRTNTGMTEMPRVSMYGVQQAIYIINNSQEKEKYVVVGHCCESGDILTTKLYDQEIIEEILLPKVNIGDIIVIDGVGAYNTAMSMKNYNSYPEVGELLIDKKGDIKEVRKRQNLKDIWKNEIY